ncbi:hypothetical protein Psal006b_01544 [Piscirickettsia salmonis]|uniref:D-alanyl-D-alanine carboxypeptidase n=1 Tax=Piscirickettsia salmonis TaxID=1238 RepID=A0A1L6TC47_PISSA|nr:hypothetical protein [Piscirickettsia salmonis]AKP74001.1 hypothetical protein PSLF89_2279 [Piscirickettsia salmonis LF-89 = ATCC VR-1361]ALB22845.1 D-alanyl-D-alanine carboxypeptidase [Piscirickettsia salmonis]ALY02824.1 hypothetical protein AWE47_08135 [Piscirickettsia salmonis]AMA42379.1 hypothetical protein AWJ11_08350 [Piscirickettsia salmonis]AOS34848.1 hypothetical protein AVM72_05490 [Piscirickettsia salmonis]
MNQDTELSLSEEKEQKNFESLCDMLYESTIKTINQHTASFNEDEPIFKQPIFMHINAAAQVLNAMINDAGDVLAEQHNEVTPELAVNELKKLTHSILFGDDHSH